VLEEAEKGSDEYYFWLADDWSNAPKEDENRDATIPPISDDWRSPFHGKTVKDAVEFMKTLPEDSYVDYHYFAVLGADFTKRRLVTICRIGDEDLMGDKLETLPCSVAGQYHYCSISRMQQNNYRYARRLDPVSVGNGTALLGGNKR
jgi:hypothetical protein